MNEFLKETTKFQMATASFLEELQKAKKRGDSTDGSNVDRDRRVG